MNHAIHALTLARRPVRSSPEPKPIRQRATPVVGLGRRFRQRILWLVILCALPVSALLAAGRLTLATDFFWIYFGLTVCCLICLGKHETLLSLLIGLTPFINLLRGRGFVFYNVLLVAFALGLLHYYARSPRTVVEVWRRYRSMVWLFILVTVYYSLSFLTSGDYSKNLRLYELCLAVFCVLVAAHNRYVLGTGLLGLIISACAIGIGMLPHNDTVGRLGMVVIEGAAVGNPVQLGLALAISFLVIAVDHGQWLGLPKSPVWKWLLWIPTAALLTLTTSRASWLVVCVGMLLVVLFGKRQRLRLLLVIALVPVVLLTALRSPFGPALQAGLNRTFNEERSLGSRTSGRSDQWKVVHAAATASLDRLVRGYGPGQGPAVYAEYSERVEGVRYGVGMQVALHSLFMQVLVELGLIGLLPLLLWLTVAMVRIVRWTRESGRLLPLVCFCGYVFAIVTISGNDTVSGTFLGIGLLATGRSIAPMRRTRKLARVRQAPAMGSSLQGIAR